MEVSSTQSIRKWSVAVAVISLLWIVFSYDALASAIVIWYGNEIFNHGFIVLPVALYLIYIKRFRLIENIVSPSLLALVFLIPAIFVYVVGVAGDVQLFMHLSAFGMFAILGWSLLGFKAAFSVLFPLFFVMFSVPVGEELIPWLQEVTADGAVAMLSASGVPLFRSGLYIEIPQGRFLVAEACSGVSFFIASIMLGSVYAYLNFASPWRRILFMAIAICYPILANAIRVYGIIMVGYLTDMEHAVGADHLIYGWFFFAIVIVSLIFIGELMREKGVVWEAPKTETSVFRVAEKPLALMLTGAVLLAAIGWQGWIKLVQQQSQTAEYSVPFVSFQHHLSNNYTSDWQPELRNPTQVSRQLVNGQSHVEVLQAWFNGKDNELISSLNKLYGEKAWTRVETYIPQQSNKVGIEHLTLETISSPTGKIRLITHWYVVGDKVFVNKVKAKLYQIYRVMTGQSAMGMMVVLTVPVSEDKSEVEADLLSTVESWRELAGM